SAIEASDGRIWFAVSDGVVSVDPANYELRQPEPTIVIQSVSANDGFPVTNGPLTFPARTSSVQITYSAVSLSDPEAVRFRYKLETDSEWREVGATDTVVYRNLSPGLYHFSVSAMNAVGVWSDRPATAEFTILPAFYQTAWFRLFSIALFL